MSDLPADVQREILLRLPAESLFRFRIVCKAWRRAIDDPDFVRAHTNNQSSHNTLLICNRAGDAFYSFSLDSLNFNNGRQIVQSTPVKQPIHHHVPRLPVASCNGLILLSDEENRQTWAIWNPLTEDVHELPELKVDLDILGCGFGYDRASNDYKVVRIDRLWRGGPKFVYHTHVYCLKRDSWRLIEDCPGGGPCLSRPGVFVNGALHWFTQGMFREQDGLIAFDLASENYHQLPLPPANLPFKLEPCEVYLDALGGCLVLSYFNNMKCFEGWVMKDYGAQESWTKLFSFKERDIIKTEVTLRPAAYLKDKNQVFLQHHGGLFWFDVESNSVKKVSIDGLSHISSSQMCLGSLFRLHDGCGVSGSAVPKTTGAKTERKSEMVDTRLTFYIRDLGTSSSDSSGSNEDEDLILWSSLF